MSYNICNVRQLIKREEYKNMEETPLEIIGIFVGVALMFLVPFFLLADRSDDISQLVVSNATASFVDNIIKTGVIEAENYTKYQNELNKSGNSYEIAIELKILDPNYAQNYTTNQNTKGELGKNHYYSIYTTQIEDRLLNNSTSNTTGDKNKIVLKEGDIISVIAKNNSMTLSQSIKNIYYTITGDDLHIISATGSGIVAINGAT